MHVWATKYPSMQLLYLNPGSSNPHLSQVDSNSHFPSVPRLPPLFFPFCCPLLSHFFITFAFLLAYSLPFWQLQGVVTHPPQISTRLWLNLPIPKTSETALPTPRMADAPDGTKRLYSVQCRQDMYSCHRHDIMPHRLVLLSSGSVQTSGGSKKMEGGRRLI